MVGVLKRIHRERVQGFREEYSGELTFTYTSYYNKMECKVRNVLSLPHQGRNRWVTGTVIEDEYNHIGALLVMHIGVP